MLSEVPAALRSPALLRAQNAAGIRGVLKQAEHLQTNCARCRQSPLPTTTVERVGPMRNALVIVFGNQILKPLAKLTGLYLPKKQKPQMSSADLCALGHFCGSFQDL